MPPQGIALKIVREAKRKHVTNGKDPSGLAAAALYVASRFENALVTQSELSRAADVTEVTIRNRKKELVEKLRLEAQGARNESARQNIQSPSQVLPA